MRQNPLLFRVKQLKQLDKLIQENEAQILEAIKADIGRGTMEGFIGEIIVLTTEIDYMVSNLPTFAQQGFMISK